MYKSMDYSNLFGIEGLSNRLLKNHFKLYEGYVNNTNKLIEILERFKNEGKLGTPEYSEIKRRFGWEFNGMRLHELYFGNIRKGGSFLDIKSNLFKKIENDFGSFRDWEEDFKSTGKMRGIGWAVLYYDVIGDILFNSWINEHDIGHPSVGIPVLVMDVFEHAYMVDYDTDKEAYINAFLKIIDWEYISSSTEGLLI